MVPEARGLPGDSFCEMPTLGGVTTRWRLHPPTATRETFWRHTLRGPAHRTARPEPRSGRASGVVDVPKASVQMRPYGAAFSPVADSRGDGVQQLLRNHGFDDDSCVAERVTSRVRPVDGADDVGYRGLD